MPKLMGFNIANVERVKIVTVETTPVTYIFETSNAANCTPAVSAGAEVEQRIKNSIEGLIVTDDIVKGYDIELDDQRMIPEVFALIDGGTNTNGESPVAWQSYAAPVAGSPVTRKKFTMTLYTSDRDQAGEANSYHAWTFAGCKGKGVPLSFSDGAFAGLKYSIVSRPGSGVSPFTVEQLEELPAVT